MKFIEYLAEESRVRKNSAAEKAGTFLSDIFAKQQIANLKAAGKEARAKIAVKADEYRSKDIYDNLFGDTDLVKLSRKHEVQVKVPVDFIKKEMDTVVPTVEKNRRFITFLSNQKRHQNGGKM